ncbi:succinylglutamate desuccinylase/aspartoacylase family protein [Flavobacteriaceae bacterium MHTCC 0001]
MTAEKTPLIILGTEVWPGDTKEVNLDVANLHTASPVNVPVIISRSKKQGPVVLFTAGIHGDEVNGIEIVRQLIAKGINQPKRGTIICMPVINIFGFINLKREFPDGRDLNRVFPGSTNGSLASRVAHKLIQDVVSHADLIIDFHTGGSARFNAPQLRYTKAQNNLDTLAEIFGAPFVVYSTNLAKSFRAVAAKLGKDLLLFEGGKSFHIDDTVTNSGVNGSKRVLKHLGMLKTIFKSSKPKKKCVFVEESKWQRAKYSGMFKAAVAVGSEIKKDDIIGNITDPYGKFNYFVRAKNSGYVINVNESPIVYQGDALFHISTKIKSY